jgi:Lysozyme like domain
MAHRTGRQRSGASGGFIASAVAAGVILAVTQGHGHGVISAVTTAAVHGGTLGCSGLEQLWEAAGGPPGSAATAASVAMAESSGQQDATDNDSNGSTDYGYWQINSVNGATSADYDPMTNARAAVKISQGGTDWTPWTTFNSGAYAGRC